MVDIAPDYELHAEVNPLKDEELKWVKRLERTLKACPSSRLVLQTMGDPDLTVIDADIVRKYDYETCDGYADDNGVVLARVRGLVQVWAVTG